jgi:hypothetical protein
MQTAKKRVNQWVFLEMIRLLSNLNLKTEILEEYWDYMDTGIDHQRTVSFEVNREDNQNILLEQDGQSIPFIVEEESAGKLKGLMNVRLPAVGTTSVHVVNKVDREMSQLKKIETGTDWIVDEFYRIEWVPSSWTIKIINKLTGEIVDFIGFTGSIGRENGHGDLYPALSPAHEIFTFAFDGTTHSPDQISLSRIKQV